MGGQLRGAAGAALLATLMVLVTVPSAVAQSTTEETFVVNAGDSRKTLDPSADLSVEGEVVNGGEEPFSYEWALDGSTEPFANASQASTTVDLRDERGPVTLTFTVTDANGDTAQDTVKYHVAERAGTLLEEALQFTVGVPATTVEAREIPFTVTEDVDALEGLLVWQDEDGVEFPVTGNDLDFELINPEGDDVTDEGQTADHPEQTFVDDPMPGEWTVRVDPYLTNDEDATVTIFNLDSPLLPRPVKPGPKLFGVEEEQELVGNADHSAAEAADWDLDNDGIYEISDERAIADKPVGEHAVGFRSVDANGYEKYNPFTFEVTDRAENTIAVLCNDRPGWDIHAMEFLASGGTCFMHSGHQTYDLGHEREIVGGEGSVLSVEQQYSPPTEYEDPLAGTTPIHIQASHDAQNWQEIDAIEYQFNEDVRDGVLLDDTLLIRQRIDYQFDAEDLNLRYLRFHEPRSAAQGLSGFLDESIAYLYVNDTAETSSIGHSHTESTSLDLSCDDGDVLEDFFSEHPCTFGGVNRYDAASVFHTYKPGEGTQADRIEAEATVDPWRSDDFFEPLQIGASQDAIQHNLDQLTETSVQLQVSQDSTTWETVAERSVTYGEPFEISAAFDDPKPAPYVRLLPGEHENFDDYKQNAPDHHLEAFLVDSSITVTGDVPVSS